MIKLRNLARLAKLERLIAAICVFIPLLLKLTDDNAPFRESISSYVSMKNSYIFGMLLTMAAMMFIFNGVIYLKDSEQAILAPEKRHGRWYNIILGIALLGIVVFPYNHDILGVLHYIFAVIFFLGSALVIAFFNDKRHRKISVFIAVISILSLLLYFIDEFFLKDEKIISLLWAEWISLFVIAIHYILESKQIITLK